MFQPFVVIEYIAVSSFISRIVTIRHGPSYGALILSSSLDYSLFRSCNSDDHTFFGPLPLIGPQLTSTSSHSLYARLQFLHLRSDLKAVCGNSKLNLFFSFQFFWNLHSLSSPISKYT